VLIIKLWGVNSFQVRCGGPVPVVKNIGLQLSQAWGLADLRNDNNVYIYVDISTSSATLVILRYNLVNANSYCCSTTRNNPFSFLDFR